MARLTHPARARRYIQASMEAGYSHQTPEVRESRHALMRHHEAAYPRVREHALAGTNRHFDEPLTAGEREHQRHLRRQDGLNEHDVKETQRQLDEAPPAGAAQRFREGAEPGAQAARSAARAAGGPLGAAASGSGSLVMQAIGILMGLSLIYLLVAGKGSQAITGVVGVVTGGVRAFVAPVDPIAAAERTFGATPINSPAAPSSAPTSATAPSKGAGGGFFAAGQSVQLRRKDQGRDVQLQPGATILAPGDGEIVRVGNDPSGFGPDYPVERFTSGPYKGRELYEGHTDTALPLHAKFKLGQILARTSRTGHNAPPGWAEIGYALDGVPGAMGQRSPF